MRAEQIESVDVHFYNNDNIGYKQPVNACIAIMLALSENQRMEVMSNFCKECGSTDRGCQCWNDE